MRTTEAPATSTAYAFSSREGAAPLSTNESVESAESPRDDVGHVLDSLPRAVRFFLRISRVLHKPHDCGRIALQVILVYAITIYRVPGVSGWMPRVNKQSPSTEWQGDPAHLYFAVNSSVLQIHNPQLSGEISYISTALLGIGYVLCIPMLSYSVYNYFADGGTDFASHVVRSRYTNQTVRLCLLRLSVPMVALWLAFFILVVIFSLGSVVQKLSLSTSFEVPSWYNVYAVLEFTSSLGLMASMPGIIFPVPTYFYIITQSAVENVRLVRAALESIIMQGNVHQDDDETAIADKIAVTLKRHGSAMRYVNARFAYVSGWACVACIVWFVVVNYNMFRKVLWNEGNGYTFYFYALLISFMAGIPLSIFSMCTWPSSEFERLIVEWIHEPDVLRRLALRAFPRAGELTLFVRGVKDYQSGRFSLKIFGVVMTRRLYVTASSAMLSVVGLGVATFLRNAS